MFTENPSVYGLPLDEFDILQICYQCGDFGNTQVTHLVKTLGYLPEIELPFVKPSLVRRASCREAYLLWKHDIAVEKVWDRMNDHQFREQVVHTLGLALAMQRLGLQHEGLEAAVKQWIKKNQ
ncbi:hypothetical protein E1L24_22485 [Salmonella enterica subsp. enterica serovar Braenderup]|nr:hypothetical protein [Salmonella enterica subsp. enterica serovar Braenderup]